MSLPRACSTRSPLDPASTVAGFRAQLAALGTAQRAVAEKAYLKSTLRFHGVTIPQVRAAAVSFCKGQPGLTRSALRALVDALYATDFHDLRSLGIAILEKKNGLLGPTDLPWLVDLVRTSANWAHVDWLATKVLGPLIAALPAGRRRSLLGSWAKDEHMWVRRTALLAQHDALRGGGGDFALFAAIAVPMLGEKEFFIRKAIGWVLREVSKRRADLVFQFLREHRTSLSGLTFREGSKHLAASMRRKLARP